MDFNRHLEISGLHAFLSPSKHYWVNYDEDRLVRSYSNSQLATRGTELHSLACQCIKLGINLPRTKSTLNQYVNDAIGFKMTPEQPLFYSWNCFGTADTISFRSKILRIHDLKSGETPGSMEQLEIYAGIFCLEYKIRPSDIKTQLRIYQFDEIEVCEPISERVEFIMDRIVKSDKVIEKLKLEV